MMDFDYCAGLVWVCGLFVLFRVAIGLVLGAFSWWLGCLVICLSLFGCAGFYL